MKALLNSSSGSSPYNSLENSWLKVCLIALCKLLIAPSAHLQPHYKRWTRNGSRTSALWLHPPNCAAMPMSSTRVGSSHCGGMLCHATQLHKGRDIASSHGVLTCTIHVYTSVSTSIPHGQLWEEFYSGSALSSVVWYGPHTRLHAGYSCLVSQRLHMGITESQRNELNCTSGQNLVTAGTKQERPQ